MNSLDLNFVARINPYGPQMRPDLSPCWEWEGHKDKRLGYAKYSKRVPGRKTSKSYKAHRYAYEQFIGTIPNFKVLDHLCRNRGCVNPWHTEPVTQRENVMRGTNQTALHSLRTHCKVGHPLEITPWDNRRRYCPVCQRESHKLAARRRRALKRGRVSIFQRTVK